MAGKRICPICENDIPERSKYYCPHCGFPLEKLNDEAAIGRAIQHFKGSMTSTKLRSEPSPQKSNKSLSQFIAGVQWKHYVVGILVSLLYGILIAGLFSFTFLFTSLLWEFVLYPLPGGFLAGFVGSWLEQKFGKSFIHKIGFMLLTIILSYIFSNIIMGWILTYFY
jgi:hypothetical protein